MDRTNSPTNFNPSDQTLPPCCVAALEYLSYGWCPIPLCPPNCSGVHRGTLPHDTDRSGKVPLIANWARLRKLPTREQVIAWWKTWPEANVGVRLGAISDMIAIDVDGPEGDALLREMLNGSPPPQPAFHTPNGGYRVIMVMTPGMKVKTRHLGGKNRPLSILGEGSQSVFPPSIGNNGGPYDWFDGLNSNRGLLRRCPKLMTALGLESPAKSGQTGGVPRSEVPAVRADGEMMERARKYLAKCEPAVEGAGGDARTFKMACKLVGQFRLSSDNALSLMMEWNKGCTPPWSEDALKRKVDLAAERHQETAAKSNSVTPRRGDAGKVGKPRPTPPRDKRATGRISLTAVPDPLEGSCTQPASLGRESRGAPARPALNGFVAMNCHADPHDQADGPEQSAPLPGVLFGEVVPRLPEWFDRPYLMRSQVTMLSGKPGTGKSTYLAQQVSRSRHALYFAGEESIEGRLHPRFAAAGVRPDQVRIIEPGEDWLFPHARDRLVQLVGRTGADLVVFDSVDDYLSADVDENCHVAVRGLLQAFRTVAELTGAAVVLCRHPGKQADNVMPGSRAWYAHPRTIVEFIADQDTPPRRIVRLRKDGWATSAPARFFDLVGDAGKPPTFTLRGEAAAEVVELVANVSDPLERSAVDRACDLIRRLLTGGRMEVKQARQYAEGEGLSERTLQRATRQVGVTTVREGNGKEHRCYWELPKIIPGIPK